VASLDELAGIAELGKINRAPARFGMDELRGLSAKLLAHLPYADVAERLREAGIDDGEAFWNAVRGNLQTLGEAAQWWEIVHGRIEGVVAPEDRVFLGEAAGHLPEEPWNERTWAAWTDALKAATGRKGKSLFLPLRLALTGLSSGPELAQLLPVLGRPRTLARLSGQSSPS
jgi:glutamyl-tRNA synthetase